MTATATLRKPTKTIAKKTPTRSTHAGGGAAIHPNEIPLAEIDPHPFNPRTEFDAAELDRLSNSLRAHGLLQPIVVRKTPTGRYQLVAGERRLRAAEKAGWKNVPAVVRDVTDSEALVLGLVENIERRDLNAIEKARGLARLCAPEKQGGCGLTQAQASAMFHHEQSWAAKLIALLTLPDVWQQRIAAGELSESHARTLVPYAKRPAVLARIEDDMLANPWSWRSREDFERNGTLLAETADTKGQPAAVGELRPMRAKPGTGADPRPSRSLVTTPPPRVDRAEPDAEPATLPFPGRSPVMVVAGPVSAAVWSIIEAVASLKTLADLDAVEGAVDDRRRRIALKA